VRNTRSSTSLRTSRSPQLAKRDILPRAQELAGLRQQLHQDHAGRRPQRRLAQQADPLPLGVELLLDRRAPRPALGQHRIHLHQGGRQPVGRLLRDGAVGRIVGGQDAE
jgi:hypothetical protein